MSSPGPFSTPTEREQKDTALKRNAKSAKKLLKLADKLVAQKNLTPQQQQLLQELNTKIQTVGAQRSLLQQLDEASNGDSHRHTRSNSTRPAQKIPKDAPRFKADHTVNRQKMVTYFERLEACARAHGWRERDEERDNGESHFVRAMLVLIENPTQGDLVFVNKQLDDGVDWEAFKPLMVARFAFADRLYDARTLLALRQGDDEVTVYTDKFLRVVKNSVDDPNEAFDTKHTIYIMMFINGLRRSVQAALAKDPRREKATASLTRTSKLARDIERDLMVEEAIADDNGELGGGKRHKPDSADTREDRNAAKHDRAPQGDGRVACTRCRKQHQGGAKVCTSRYDTDGLLIKGDPPVFNKAQEELYQTGCMKCHKKDHRAFACPDKPKKALFVKKFSMQPTAQHTAPCPLCRGDHAAMYCPTIGNKEASESEEDY
jgi:hypothetical protein